MLNKANYTCLERRLHEGLEVRGFNFEPQFPTKSGFIIDFMVFVEDDGKELGRIAVEADGEMWHQDKRREKFRDKILMKDDRTKVVLHFKGQEINEKLNECLDLVQRAIGFITSATEKGLY